MPKEKMLVGQCNAPGEPSKSRVIEIGWMKDYAYVDLAITTIADDTGELVPGETVRVDSMTWIQVNGLIRHLRRARDDANGKPE